MVTKICKFCHKEFETDNYRLWYHEKCKIIKHNSYMKRYMRKYIQTPKEKERRKEYFNRPEIKKVKSEYMKEYNKRPEVEVRKQIYENKQETKDMRKRTKSKKRELENEKQRNI